MNLTFSQLETTQDAEAYLADYAFVAQEKMDGRRAIITLRDGKVSDTSRNGVVREASASARLAALAEQANGTASITVDGEQMEDGRFIAFDILELNGIDLSPFPYAARWGALTHTSFATVRHAESEQAKRELFDAVRIEGGEGIVFKSVAARHSMAGGLRFKFWKMDTFRVIESAPGRASIAIETLAGVPAGRCGVDFERRPAAGSLVEIRHDGFTASGKLTRPVFLRVRDDI